METTDAQDAFYTHHRDHTAVESEQTIFYGEVPDPRLFAMPEPPVEIGIEIDVIWTVIDGELRIVLNDCPPGAQLPDPDAPIFRLAEVSDG